MEEYEFRYYASVIQIEKRLEEKLAYIQDYFVVIQVLSIIQFILENAYEQLSFKMEYLNFRFKYSAKKKINKTARKQFNFIFYAINQHSLKCWES